MSALDAVTDLQAAMYRESNLLHADATGWPPETANALLQAKTHAHRVRRFLVAGTSADLLAEAEKSFRAIDAERLWPVFDGNAHLPLAFDALAGFLAETVP